MRIFDLRSVATLCAVLFSLLPLHAQHGEKQGEKKKHPAIGDPVAIAAGSKLFTNSCAGCHGPRGEGGRGPNLRNRGAWHTLDETDLFQTIQKGVPGADMPGTNLPDSQIWQLVALVTSLSAPAIEFKLPGDAAAGEQLFWGKAECGGCHRILGKGGMLGPDLSNIGALRPVDQIRQAIVDPDADGFPRYRGITVVTKSGQKVEGVARDRTNYALQILDKNGKLHRLNAADLKELVLSEHSPMPGDYGKRLNRQEIDNLIAYLGRQSVRPYPEVDNKK